MTVLTNTEMGVLIVIVIFVVGSIYVAYKDDKDIVG